MDSLHAIASAMTEQFVGWSVVLAILTTFELVNGRGRQSIRSRVNGIAYWIMLIVAAVLVNRLFVDLWHWLGVKPLMTLPLSGAFAWAGVAGVIAAIVAGSVVHDFGFYWFHRFQHRWLWKWHAVHHSIEDLNAVNSYHHVSESLFSLVLLQAPLSLLLVDTGPVIPWLNLLLWCQIVWIHSPTRITLGPLRIAIADNRFHRIHHSLEERHFDKNFGAVTTLWDRMFGTHHAPAPNEWPDVGLAEVRAPADLREWLDLPFRYARATKNNPAAADAATGATLTGAF